MSEFRNKIGDELLTIAEVLKELLAPPLDTKKSTRRAPASKQSKVANKAALLNKEDSAIIGRENQGQQLEEPVMAAQYGATNATNTDFSTEIAPSEAAVGAQRPAHKPQNNPDKAKEDDRELGLVTEIMGLLQSSNLGLSEVARLRELVRNLSRNVPGISLDGVEKKLEEIEKKIKNDAIYAYLATVEIQNQQFGLAGANNSHNPGDFIAGAAADFAFGVRIATDLVLAIITNEQLSEAEKCKKLEEEYEKNHEILSKLLEDQNVDMIFDLFAKSRDNKEKLLADSDEIVRFLERNPELCPNQEAANALAVMLLIRSRLQADLAQRTERMMQEALSGNMGIENNGLVNKKLSNISEDLLREVNSVPYPGRNFGVLRFLEQGGEKQQGMLLR